MSNAKYYPRKSYLLEELKQYAPDLDVNRTISMTRFSFIDLQGEQFLGYTPDAFEDNFNKRFGDILVKDSVMSAGMQSMLAEINPDAEKKEIVDAPQEEKEESLPEEETPLISLEAKIEEEVEIEQPSTEEIFVDWEMVNSLKGTRDDKQKLDTYAEEKFGIKLNRAKKIDNMRQDFKEALEAM